MVRVGVIGLGKMGLSHLSMIRAHPDVEVVAICDATAYMIDILGKYTGVRGFTDSRAMLAEVEMDALIVSTPSASHAPLVRAALERGLHVFCEKPFVLDTEEGEALARLAAERGRVNQVGYHYRFVGAFQEMKRLLDAGTIGTVSHVLAEAYGPVVVKPKGSSWRNKRSEGGGALYDYAAHPINLLNWYFGPALEARGTVLGQVFSRETEDEVYGTLRFRDNISGQVSVNWSDESHRKMTTKITVWGTEGKLYADRQEIQVFLRDNATPPPGYLAGWNVRYTTDLTQPVYFYVRGEEYSAQLDYFVAAIRASRLENVNSFASANETDRALSMLIADARGESTAASADRVSRAPEKRRRWFFAAS